MMEIEEQIQSEPHIILQEGHVVAESNEYGTNDAMSIDKSLFEFDVTIVGKNGQVQLIRKDDNKNRVFKARLTFHNPKFSFNDWNVLPAKLEEEPIAKKRKSENGLTAGPSSTNTLLLETKYIVKGKRDDEYYNTTLEPPSFEEGRIVDFDMLPPDQKNVVDFRLSKFLTTKEVRSALKDAFKEIKEIGRDQICLRFSLTHAESRKEVASFNFPWQNPPKKTLPSPLKSELSTSGIVDKSNLHSSSLNNSNGINSSNVSSSSSSSSSAILPIDSPALKIKPESIEVMDLSQSRMIGDNLPDIWRLVDLEQSEHGIQISETKRYNLVTKGKTVVLKALTGDSIVDNQENKNLFLAGVCYKMDGKWFFKSGSGFVLESARQADNGIEVVVRATHANFSPCHILFTPTVESINIDDLTSIPLLYSSATSVISNMANKAIREVDLMMYIHDDKLTHDDLVRIIRAHFDKRMNGARYSIPKLHEAQIQRFAKQAFTFDAHANALAFITREAFEPFWEWFLEIEDVIERVASVWNGGGIHIMDATEAQAILDGQEEGTFLFRLTNPPLVGIVISLVNARKHIVHYTIRKDELTGDRLIQAMKLFGILKQYIVTPYRGSRPIEVADKPSFNNLNQILESYRVDSFMTLFIKECILNMPSIHQELSEMGVGRSVNVVFQGKSKQLLIPPSFTFDQLIKACNVKDHHLYEFSLDGKILPGAALIGDLLGNINETPTLVLQRKEIWE